MLKQMLLIGAAAISFPALAQTPPADDPNAPPAQTEPAPPAGEPAEPAPQPTPAPDASTTPSAGEATTAQPAPAQGTAATPTQVAQIVNQEFPTYDADSNAELSEAEFAAWMKKLRAATEPSVDVESVEVQTWIGQAYSAADADKSGSVSKEELTSFLSRGA